MSNKVYSVIIVGVGGQGVLLAGRILGNVAFSEKYDVKIREYHGLSQRGGSVRSIVSFGNEVTNSDLSNRKADIMVSLDSKETVRNLNLLKQNGCIISLEVNDVYDNKSLDISKKVIELLKENYRCYFMKRNSGMNKNANIALLGRLSMLLPFSTNNWMKTIDNMGIIKKSPNVKKIFYSGELIEDTVEFDD